MRAYIDDLLPDVLEGRIEPDASSTAPSIGVPDGYRGMNDVVSRYRAEGPFGLPRKGEIANRKLRNPFERPALVRIG